jgi:hypothetical protein
MLQTLLLVITAELDSMCLINEEIFSSMHVRILLLMI